MSETPEHAAETSDLATESHDQPVPEAYAAFMRDGLGRARARPAPPLRSPTGRRAPAAGWPRRSPASGSSSRPARFKVRANDTDYRFRADTAHVHLTGNQTSDAVLVVEDGEAVLYARPRSSRQTDEFFRDRRYGELWAGRRPSLKEISDSLGVRGAATSTSSTARLERLGQDPRAARRRPVRRPGGRPATAARDHDFARVLSELRLVKDAWELEQLQEACDITALGFEDCVREWDSVLEYGERWIEGTFFRRARTMGNDLGYDSIVGRRLARDDAALDREHRPGHARSAAAARHGRRGQQPLHRRRDPHAAGRRHVHRRCSATSTTLVLEAQQAGIDAVRPGAAFRAPHEAAMRVLAHGLEDLGLLPGLRRGGAVPGQQGLRTLDAARDQPHARPRRARLRRAPPPRPTSTATSRRAWC